MHTKSHVFLQLLLSKYHPGAKESFVRGLPAEDVQEIFAQELPSKSFEELLFPLETILERMHYSWLVPIFQHIPQSLRASFLSIIPAFQVSKLKKWFPVEETPALSAPAKKFLQQNFFNRLDKPEVIPLSFLPTTPLTPLAYWRKDKLVMLIDFLGIFDLAAEVRQIIQKERIQKISSCLSSKQKQFLHTCLHHTDKLMTRPIELEKWDGSCEKLATILHKRGLIRLAKALCGHHEDFIWHLSHVLDVGRGSFIQQHYSHTALPGVTPVLVQQVTNVMSFLA